MRYLTGFEHGDHNITVVYTDADGTPSVVTQQIKVPKWDSRVEASAATIREGDDSNIIVKVGSENMTGLVRVDIDGTGYYANMTDGVITIVAPGIKKGTYLENVTYDGNWKYMPANNTFTLVVEAPIEIHVEGAGNSTRIVVDLPENATDNLTVMVDGSEYPVTYENGSAVVNLNNVSAGNHNVTVVYTDSNGTKSVSTSQSWCTTQSRQTT